MDCLFLKVKLIFHLEYTDELTVTLTNADGQKDATILGKVLINYVPKYLFKYYYNNTIIVKLIYEISYYRSNV